MKVAKRNILFQVFKARFPYTFAAILMGVFFLLPPLANAITGQGSRHADGQSIAHAIQYALSFPLSHGVTMKGWKLLLLLPHFLLWGFLLRIIHVLLKNRYRYFFGILFLAFLILRIFPDILLIGESSEPSRSYGNPSKGRLEKGKRVPFSGPNYTTYSFLGYLAGRTFVDERVRKTVLETYQLCEQELPDIGFVLMETGHRSGGRFLPHRTHRNGMSVDFMTPMLKEGKPWQSHSIFRLWGYGWEFDDKGVKDKLSIDYETLAKHLLLLYQTAPKHGLRIKKVIFDPVLQPYLFQTPSGKLLKGKFYFTRGRVVFRHDDHYHVDFEIAN